MDTHKKFIAHLDELAKQKITMPAIAKRSGIDYSRLRNIKNPVNSNKAAKEDLEALEKAFENELHLELTEEEKHILDQLQRKVSTLLAEKDGHKKIIQALTKIIEENPDDVSNWRSVEDVIEDLKKLS
jgi:uncharacterized protein YpuA (DUF1002 family)